MNNITLVTTLVLATAACGKTARLDKPYTGAPIAFEVKQLHPGTGYKGSLDIRAVNFSDETIVQYAIVARYYDASDKIVQVDGKDHVWTSFAGKHYACPANDSCTFTIDHFDVPSNATRAEVLATEVTGTHDNVKVDDKPLFSIATGEWPAKPGAKS
jgi:hypothetical protein